MKLAVVDFQGFTINGSFQPKELCVNNGHQIAHFLVKPEVKFSSLSMQDQKVVRWLENNFHGIKYNLGCGVELSDVGDILRRLLSDVDIVYVKGSQKKEYLLGIGLSVIVIDLNQLEHYNPPPPNLTMQRPLCMYHDGNVSRMCSMANCRDIFNWLWNAIPH